MVSWTEAVQEAVLAPPICLEPLKLTPQPAEEETYVVYDVSCKACGSSLLSLFASPIVNDEGRSQGRLKWRPPHSCQCVACGMTTRLFDPRIDGYDAIVNDFSATQVDDAGQSAIPGPVSITMCLTYSMDWDDLSREAASKAGRSIGDLFDWITIVATPAGEGPEVELSYECA